jgi:putative hydrolase of the HAD superfamily
MIRTIILDLGNVIIPFDFEKGYAALAGRCPYPASEIRKRIASTDLVPRFESGQIEPEDFVRDLSELLGLSVGFEEFCALWSSIFYTESLIPESMITALKNRYRLLLLSNTNALHFRMLRDTFPLFSHFDEYILSYEVGAMKPAPEIYGRAIAAAKCRADECFFTDDIQAYVDGAVKAGIDAVQFRSLDRLKEDLASRNVVW